MKKSKTTIDRHIIALDPGKSSFAYCAVLGTSIKSLGMITETIDDLKSGVFPYRLRMFYRQFKKIITTSEAKHGKVTDIIAERYLSRPGKGGGAVGESINVMLGVIALYCLKHGIHIELVSSSLWKNRMRKRLGGDTQAERYGFPWVQKNELKGNPYPIKDHEFDATGIALAYLETAPAHSNTNKKQNLDHFQTFQKQLRSIWNKRAKEIGYDENKDIAREEKSKQRKQAIEASSVGGVQGKTRKKAIVEKTTARKQKPGRSVKQKKDKGKRKSSR